ncbi:MAG: hypothetical protein R3C16_07355 [Hyphomonadaceae bacterium]
MALTPLGDEIELKAVERLFGNATANLSPSSTKSAIGHLPEKAGRGRNHLLREGDPRRHCSADAEPENPSIETAIDLTPKTAKKRSDAVDVKLTGFGGTNAAVILTAD